jgi:hypothetical protein
MMFLYPLLLIITDPFFSWSQSAGIGRGIGGIGWIVDPAIRVIAIFIVSLLSGIVLVRDRWVVRPAATISVLWFLFYATRGLIHLLRVGEREEVSLYVRSWMIPLVLATAVAFLFSPFFHDCGRVLRSYLQNRMAGRQRG